MTVETDRPTPPDSGRFSRRDFLRLGSIVGASGAIAVALPGATSGASFSSRDATAAYRRKSGGTLKVGILGGSSSDTLAASAPIGVPDYARGRALYSTLATFDETNNIVPFLAESIESNASASTYTIRLRQGSIFHNGKPVLPEDVIFSLQRVVSQSLAAAPMLAGFNSKNVKVLDTRTLRIPLAAPSVLFLVGLAAQGSPVNIVPVGYTPSKPIGTGPFMYKSFTPGRQSVFVRNPHYFESGVPYLDTLLLIDYPDANARFDAFISGELDAIDAVPFAQVASLKGRSGKTLLEAKTGLALLEYMRTDVTPFNDPNVRLAMKLIVTRPKMIEVAGGGYGSEGDDVLGKYFPTYNPSLPQRHQDIDQAKYLLKKAGRSGMTVTLTTATFTAGATEQAALLAQFARQAGFTIKLNQTTAANIFGPRYVPNGYATSWTFAQDFFSGGTYLYQASLSLAKGATYDETHFSNSKFNALYAQANSTADQQKRYEIIHEMQQIDFDLGGDIIPYYGTIFDAYESSEFTGFQPASITGYSFDDYDFSHVFRV